MGTADRLRLRFGLVRIGAERADRALRATGLLGQADSAPVVLQKMAKTHALFGRHYSGQVGLDFVRVGIRGKGKPLREAHYMGIDANCGLAESVAEDDIRRFPTDPRQRQQFL